MDRPDDRNGTADLLIRRRNRRRRRRRRRRRTNKEQVPIRLGPAVHCRPRRPD